MLFSLKENSRIDLLMVAAFTMSFMDASSLSNFVYVSPSPHTSMFFSKEHNNLIIPSLLSYPHSFSPYLSLFPSLFLFLSLCFSLSPSLSHTHTHALPFPRNIPPPLSQACDGGQSACGWLARCCVLLFFLKNPLIYHLNLN